MPPVLWVMLAAIVLMFGREILTSLLELVHPFQHRDVPLADLDFHLDQFFRRAFRGAKMLITDQNTGLVVQIRKWYAPGARWRAPDDPEGKIIETTITAELLGFRGLPDAPWLRRLEDTTFGFTWRIREQKKGRSVLQFYDIVGLECVQVLVHAILEEHYALGKNARTRIRVKGRIAWADVTIHGRTRLSLPTAPQIVNVTPYKWYQTYLPWGTYYFGRLIRKAFLFFFPPRPPTLK